MLVDDHRAVLWGLAKLVDGERPRMEVVGTATACTEAVELAGKVAPDVAVLDLDLGGESGISAIRAFNARPGTKVLVLTGLRDAALRDQAVLSGARGVVHKEDPAETILRAIEKVHEGEIWLDRATTGRVFVELSRTSTGPRPDAEKAKRTLLTARERELISQLSADPSANYRKIAEKLQISEHTVRNHLTNIYGKLGVINRLELFVYARQNGLGEQ
jgi:DNA-binding NarL/FixJ family response regulator